MATCFVCGLECAGTSLNAHYPGSSGSPTTTTTARTGGRALSIAAAGAAKYVRCGSTSTTAGVTRFYIYFPTLPAADVTELLRIDSSGTMNGVLGFELASGKLRARIDRNAGWQLGPVIAAATWYCIDMVLDVHANPLTLSWAVDGAAQTGDSFANVALAIVDVYFGTTVVDTFTAYYDDLMAANLATDYPLGAGTVQGFLVGITSGTHAQTAGDLKTSASVNVTSGDGSGGEVDEANADSTTFINQAVARATSYWEGIYATSGATDAPTAVAQIDAVKSTATTANNEKSQLWDGSGAADARALTSIGSASLVYRRKHWDAAPSTGAWTLAKFQAARIRWGFSTDIAPVPALSWSMLEANFASGSTPISGTGAVAEPSANAGTGAETFSGPGAVASAASASAGTAAETFSGSGAVASAASVSAGAGTLSAPSFTGTGAIAIATANAGTGTYTPLAITGTGAVARSTANAGIGSETFAGPGAVAIAAALAGTASETFSGTGTVARVVAASGTGAETFAGTGAVARPSASAGTGGQTFSGAGAIARPSASAGTGAETFSGSGAVVRGSASSGTGIGAPGFSGAGAVAIASANAGTGAEVFAGTGAVAASMATSGTGTAQAPAITGAGSVAIAVALAGAGAELFTGSGALAFNAAIAGAGGLEFAGAGAIVAAIAAAGSGTVVVPPPIGLAAQMRIASVAVGMSMASAPGMSARSISDAPVITSARFIP